MFVHSPHWRHVSATTLGGVISCSASAPVTNCVKKPAEACQAMWQWKGQTPGAREIQQRARVCWGGSSGLPGFPEASNCITRCPFLRSWTTSLRWGLFALTILPSHSPSPSCRMYMLKPCRCMGWLYSTCQYISKLI